MIYHVLPINDIKDHVEQSTCPCEPEVVVEGGDLIIAHNSWDGREGLEQALEVYKEDR